MVEEQHVQRSWGWKVQGVLGHNNHLRWLELRELGEKGEPRSGCKEPPMLWGDSYCSFPHISIERRALCLQEGKTLNGGLPLSPLQKEMPLLIGRLGYSHVNMCFPLSLWVLFAHHKRVPTMQPSHASATEIHFLMAAPAGFIFCFVSC